MAGKIDEVDSELNQEAEAHHEAGNVGKNPVGVAHDLQNRSAIIIFKTSLIVSETGVAQRIVHVDEHFPILALIVCGELDAARKVFWNIGTGVFLMREVEQLDGVGLIIATEA